MKNEYKQYFLRMCEKIDIPEYNNVMTVNEYIIEAMKNFSLSLADIEAILRSIKSRICLIGLPLSYYNTGAYKFFSKNFIENRICNYALWIELYGLKALETLLRDNGWTDDDVDKSLKDTGFLMI